MKIQFSLNSLHPFRLMILLFVFAISLSACKDDDDDDVNPVDKNLVQVVQDANNLTVLEQALTKFPDLVSTLSGNGNFTVFAPTDQAFTALLSAIPQWNSLDDIPDAVLREVLEYHVIASAKLMSSQINTGNSPATVQGEVIAITKTGMTVRLNNSANVSTADVEATNGVAHIIDAVIIPPSFASLLGTIAGQVIINNDFSILVAALTKADLVGVFAGEGNFTVFAPTNEAFEAAGINNVDGLTKEQLIPILQYHVLGSEKTAAAITAMETTILPASATTDNKLYIDKNTNGVFINGTAEVTAPDLEASNGVIHVIDKVLMAPTKNIVTIAVESSQANPAEFTTLVAALQAADLVSTVQNGTFTVFAPTDAAFAALPDGVLEDLLKPENKAQLAKILTYHVVQGKVFSSGIPNLANGEATTVQGQKITFTNNGIADTGGTDATAGLVTEKLNIHGINGVIHVIDKVLLPQ